MSARTPPKGQVTQTSLLGEEAGVVVGVLKRAHRPPTVERQVVARVLHLGAGRQSSVLAEQIVTGELDANLVIFCDTGDEPAWVYSQVAYLKGRLATVGVPLVVQQRSERGIVGDIMFNLDHRFASLPFYTRDPKTGKVGRMKRQCTKEYKIEPSDDFLLDWLVEHGHATVVVDRNGKRSRRVKLSVKTVNIYGISYEEFYRSGRRGSAWQEATYPLIDARMTAADCIAWLRARGLPVPEKSACRICPFHDDRYWLWLKTEKRADFDHACAFDDWLRSPDAKSRKQLVGLRQDVFLHRLCVPLRSIDFDALIAAADDAPLLDLCGDHCMT